MNPPLRDLDMLVRCLRWRRPRLIASLLRWVAVAVLASAAAFWWPTQALTIAFAALGMAIARACQIHRLNRKLEELE